MDGKITTTVRLNRAVWDRLRRMAGDHAFANGGRPSASAVIERLVVEQAAREKGREVHADA